jgi:glycosyltransferase involved in cell wall biosynthesis
VLSVIIPAHNEEAVIERCLGRLLADPSSGRLEIIVAANGCTDRTVELASRFGRVRVIEVDVASKHQALSAGDAAASHFPRAFVDADIEVGADALLAVARAMAREGVPAGAPSMRLDLSGCPWVVRAFCRVWTALDWNTDAPIGSGVYVLSYAGHQRLGRFPEIINDDQYVHDLFHRDERVSLSDHVFVARPPRTLRGLVLRRTRTLEGQRELHDIFGTLPGYASGPGLATLLRRRPWLALDIPVFMGVTLAARRALRRKQERGLSGWERDDSSRAIADGGGLAS